MFWAIHYYNADGYCRLGCRDNFSGIVQLLSKIIEDRVPEVDIDQYLPIDNPDVKERYRIPLGNHYFVISCFEYI